MSPELVDPALKPRRPRRAAQPPPATHRRVAQLDLPDEEPPLIAALPAILNDSIKDAPIAVMTRIALDWIIRGTPISSWSCSTSSAAITPRPARRSWIASST